MAEPDAKLMALAMKGPIDPALAQMPEDINDLFLPGYLPGENGWCILPNGAGYVSTCLPMPGVTVDMIEWWFAWHPLESLRYMLWYPGRHFSARVDETDRQKILDPTVRMRDKISGVTHYIREDARETEGLTEETPEFTIQFRYPEEIGLDMSRFEDPSSGTVVCASPHLPPDGSMPDKARIMCHFVRSVPGGVEFRSRFWMRGYIVKDGKAQFVGLPQALPESAPYGLIRHCITEYSNLRSFLTTLYKEMGGRLA